MSSLTSLLTARQSEILEFIRHSLMEAGAPPTREEISRAFGFRSLNAAEQHLQALQKKGLIELVSGTSRGIRLKETLLELKQTSAEFGLPLVGKVAAGSPILAQENVLRHATVDPAMFKPRADYLLEVRGMSMRDAGILDGDLLAVRQASEARNGQIVVARVDGGVTVKRLRRRGNTIELLPENPDFEPIVVDARSDDFALEGIGVGLVRSGKSL